MRVHTAITQGKRVQKGNEEMQKEIGREKNKERSLFDVGCVW